MSSWLGVVITFAVTEDMYVCPEGGRAYDQFREWVERGEYVYEMETRISTAHPLVVHQYSIKNMQPKEVEDAFRRMPWMECATLVMCQEGHDAIQIHYAGPDKPETVSGPQT